MCLNSCKTPPKKEINVIVPSVYFPSFPDITKYEIVNFYKEDGSIKGRYIPEELWIEFAIYGAETEAAVQALYSIPN